MAYTEDTAVFEII